MTCKLTIVNTRVLSILACRPILSTMSSTSPLQDIRAPIANDSRQTSPFSLAATAQPKNLEQKATIVTATKYAQVFALSNKPRLVLRPDKVKYSGRKSVIMRSSIFSVTLIANPPSCGMMRPARNAPKIGCTPIAPVKNDDPRHCE